MPRYTVNVNGKPQKLEADADSQVLYVLRDQLELHGPKFGCSTCAVRRLHRLFSRRRCNTRMLRCRY